MALLSRLRRFVDWDFQTSGVSSGHASVFVAILLWVPVLVFRHSVSSRTATAMLVLTAAVTATWVTFVVWRGWSLLKASAQNADRLYDQEGKLKLSAEYRDTESASRAPRRRKRD
jgi:hypothetical protein